MKFRAASATTLWYPIALTVLASLALQPALAETEVVWGHGSGSLTLDQADRGGPVDMHFVFLIFEPLVQRPDHFNPDGGLPDWKTGVAHDWHLTDDGLVWTFFLRQGVQFHRGYGEITARDVKYSFERARDPKKAFPRRGEFDMVREIKVIEDHTIEFHLTEPFAPFLQFLAVQFFRLYCEPACRCGVGRRGVQPQSCRYRPT